MSQHNGILKAPFPLNQSLVLCFMPVCSGVHLAFERWKKNTVLLCSGFFFGGVCSFLEDRFGWRTVFEIGCVSLCMWVKWGAYPMNFQQDYSAGEAQLCAVVLFYLLLGFGPETTLHPQAACGFMRQLCLLSPTGRNVWCEKKTFPR